MIQFKFRPLEIPPNYNANHLGMLQLQRAMLIVFTWICFTLKFNYHFVWYYLRPILLFFNGKFYTPSRGMIWYHVDFWRKSCVRLIWSLTPVLLYSNNMNYKYTLKRVKITNLIISGLYIMFFCLFQPSNCHFSRFLFESNHSLYIDISICMTGPNSLLVLHLILSLIDANPSFPFAFISFYCHLAHLSISIFSF